MEQRKALLIVGPGGLTGRSQVTRDYLVLAGWEVNVRSIDQIPTNKSNTLVIMDDQDFAEIELRMANAIITGHSHPEQFGFYEDFKFIKTPEPCLPPAKPKKNTGPRNRWGGLK